MRNSYWLLLLLCVVFPFVRVTRAQECEDGMCVSDEEFDTMQAEIDAARGNIQSRDDTIKKLEEANAQCDKNSEDLEAALDEAREKQAAAEKRANDEKRARKKADKDRKSKHSGVDNGDDIPQAWKNFAFEEIRAKSPYPTDFDVLHQPYLITTQPCEEWGLERASDEKCYHDSSWGTLYFCKRSTKVRAVTAFSGFKYHFNQDSCDTWLRNCRRAGNTLKY